MLHLFPKQCGLDCSLSVPSHSAQLPSKDRRWPPCRQTVSDAQFSSRLPSLQNWPQSATPCPMMFFLHLVWFHDGFLARMVLLHLGGPFSASFVGRSFCIYHFDIGVLEGSFFCSAIFFIIMVFWRNLNKVLVTTYKLALPSGFP